MSIRQPVTGAEAGLSNEIQIVIALKVIAANGGVASTRQIYSGVDFCLGPKRALSNQGKHSLRFFVNHVGVENGYIAPFDDQDPGWRATAEGSDYLQDNLDHLECLKLLTPATGNFAFAMHDIYALLDFYDEQAGQGKPDPKFDVFKRTAIILAVTAWETYIEDALTVEFTSRLGRAATPSEVESTFNLAAQHWCEQIRDPSSRFPTPPDFEQWTGDHWKELIRQTFFADIARLNTPNSENVKKLFKRYLGINVREGWKWPGMSAQKACTKLDELIRLRGELVHRGSDPLERTAKIPRQELVRVINFVERLVRRTQSTIVEDNNA